MDVWRNPATMSWPPSPHLWTPSFTLVLVFPKEFVFHHLLDEEGHSPTVILSVLIASVCTSVLSPKYQTQYTIVFRESLPGYIPQFGKN